MRAVTITPREPDSLRLEELEAPPGPEHGAILARTLAVGVCGTDRELIAGGYGEAPPGRARLVLGHESLGRVEEAPAQSGFARGDLIVGVVRQPDPVPCQNCAVGEWDMCRNGRYVERGIKQADGFCAEYFRVAPRMAIKVEPRLGRCGVLLEPASVLAKAWEHVERIGGRARWAPRRVLVTGAGPVGLLGAMLGVQRGLEVHVYDHNESGPKPALARALGASYHHRGLPQQDFDVVLETTGNDGVIRGVFAYDCPNTVVCLLGLGEGGHEIGVDAGLFTRAMVLRNRVIFGAVNANCRHYRAAADGLARAEQAWLERLITRTVPLEDWQQAYEKRRWDVKTVLSFED